jgi:hypothetical protein
VDPATVATRALNEFGPKWENIRTRLELVPGKDVLAELRQSLSERYGVSLSDNRIVASYRKEEIPSDISDFLVRLEQFRTTDASSSNPGGDVSGIGGGGA